MAKMILSPAQAGWQIDLNSRLRNSDQIDSVTSVRSVRDKKTLLRVGSRGGKTIVCHGWKRGKEMMSC